MKRRTLLQASPGLLGLPAWAQTPYPSKAIRYICLLYTSDAADE